MFQEKIIHADFQGLTVGQELDIDVPFEIVGDAPGVKAGGILNTSVTSCKIRTLPKKHPRNYPDRCFRNGNR